MKKEMNAAIHNIRIWQEMKERYLTMNYTPDEADKLCAIAMAVACKPMDAAILKATLDTFNQDIDRIRQAAPDGADRLQETATGTNEDRIFATMKNIFNGGTQEALEIWQTLEPYIEDGDDDAIYIIAKAAEAARKDSKELPKLAAEQIAEHLELKNETRLALAADKDIGFEYFTSRVIWWIPNIKKYILDDSGRINIFDLTKDGKPLEKVLQKVDRLHTAFLMYLFGQAMSCDLHDNTRMNALIPLDVRQFFKITGIEARPVQWDADKQKVIKLDADLSMAEHRRRRFLEFLMPMDCFAGYFSKDAAFYRVAGFHTYDMKNEICYVMAPYMLRLAEYRMESSKGGILDFLFNANVVGEKNQTAVELANRIVMGIRLRGLTPSANFKPQMKKHTTKRTLPDGTKRVDIDEYVDPDAETFSVTDPDTGRTKTKTTHKPKSKPVTYDVKFLTLIEDSPALQKELDDILTDGGEHIAQRYNKKLKDTFTAAVRIIMDKSDVPKYYRDLTITTDGFDTFKAPTKSTLKSKLIVTHYGKNPNYLAN